MTLVSVLAGGLLLLGSFFCVTGAIGLLRFPDLYTRIHAAGITDSLGAGLMVLGLLVVTALGEEGWVPGLVDGDVDVVRDGLLVSVKLVSVLFFMWVSGTTAVHALAKAAWLDGQEPWTPGDGEGR